MPNITENTRRFIENSNIDYFTHFIKVWIPFNAWYKNKWTNIHTDREAINKIKDSSNEIRTAIINFLENESDDAKTFRSHLSSLHYQLLENRIENNGKIISFQNVVIGKNRNRNINETYQRIKYILTRTDSRNDVTQMSIKVRDHNGNDKIPEIIQTEYNKADLQDNRDFQKLTQTQQDKVLQFYDELIPYKSINLICQNENNDHMVIGSFKFIGDREKIAQGLIEIIYSLRCVLFHGELNPNEANNEVYKNLYNIVFMLIQKIR